MLTKHQFGVQLALPLALICTTLTSVALGDEEFPQPGAQQQQTNTPAATERPEKIVKSEAEWRRQLTRLQFRITRKGGTERAFSGKYWRHKAPGTYHCVCCDEPLFHSSTKFRSGTGWPSFFRPIDDKRIAQRVDRSWFQTRMEVLCQRCDAHLGHVFPDGPPPTGLRYCLNSAALKFTAEKKSRAEKKTEDPTTPARATQAQTTAPAGQANGDSR